MTALSYEKLSAPRTGTRVTVDAKGWYIPDDPIVCLLRGDGIGRDVGGATGITTCAVRVLDAAVEKVYKGKRRVHWFDVHAGDVARELYVPQVKDEQVHSLSEEDQRREHSPLARRRFEDDCARHARADQYTLRYLVDMNARGDALG